MVEQSSHRPGHGFTPNYLGLLAHMTYVDKARGMDYLFVRRANSTLGGTHALVITPIFQTRAPVVVRDESLRS